MIDLHLSKYARALATLALSVFVVLSPLSVAPRAHAADLDQRAMTAPRVVASSVCDTTGTPTTTVYLPNITKTLGGPSGWDTPFYVQNAGAIQTTVEISLFRFRDGGLVACRKTTALAPGTSLLYDPNAEADLPNDSQFSSVVKSFGAPIVAMVNQVQGSGPQTEGLSYSGFSTGATKVFLPNVTRRFFGYDVPFIIQNLGTATTLVTAAFVSFDGANKFQTSLSVTPGRSGVIDPDFTPGLIDGTQYAVTLTATQPIAVVVNAHDELIGPVAFSHNGLSAGGTTLYAPYAAKIPNGMFSPVVVQNIGTTPADATLAFSPLLGGAPQTFTLNAIPVGGSRAFDPRFALGTATPCAIAAATCLGPGEFSLKIQSTAPVAAVVLPNSPSTAAGYLAASDLQPRSLLPIVMRRAGGPSGWSTMIYAQSGTATQATARFYALATGALVATQPVAFTNGTARLDPLSVPALRDEGQYSVTIDGNGATLTAIAHERAASGGDASMIYEGFAMPSLPVSPQAGSVKLSPLAVTVTGNLNQQFTAEVNDQFGSPFPGAAITWSVNPPTLGTITSTGLFTAGPTSGAGTVSMTTAGMSVSAAVTIQGATTATIGGITFRIASTASADFYSDTIISEADTRTLASEIEPAIAFLKADFGRPFAARPQIFAFGTTATQTLAWTTVLGISGPASTSWAGIFAAESGRIGLNWPSMSTAKPYRTIRHELTHQMEHQLTRNRLFPRWFDEGLARFEDLTVPGGAYRIMDSRFGVGSMASTATLLNVMTITDDQFYSEIGSRGEYAYYEGAETVRLMRSDITQPGIVRLLETIGAGQSFDSAYAIVSGQPLSSFAASRNARLRALAPAPGIATAPDTFLGPGLSIEVYGLTPLAILSMTITGQNGGGSTAAGTANEFGVYRTYLGSSWPQQTYTITVTSGALTLNTTAVKSDSISVNAAQFLDAGDQYLAGAPALGVAYQD